ncbi:MAG: DUF885 domain-containing protein [Acidobacteria bacterium]|nr:DUF885 domain-containing protein [Acidobacteriota bacterium]
MLKSVLRSIAVAAVLCSTVPNALHAQADPVERSRTLNALFKEYWEDLLLHSPETATYLGDKRYNDRWSDYSAAGVADQLRREREFIERLGAIDTKGLSDQDKLSAELLMRSLVDDQESARFKEWEMPVNQFNGIHTSLPQLVAVTPFENVKDYDDYIKRLNGVPHVFSQVMEDMDAGIRDGRVPPKFLLEKVVVQVNAIIAPKPEDSPFAACLKKFPAGVSAEEQKRIHDAVIDAITKQVYPSYQRFEKYLQTTYIPKGRTEPGIWAITDGDAYYKFRIRQSVTLDKSPDEIHNIGLAEVKRDEAEMLAIAKKLGFNDLKTFNAALKKNPKEHPTSKAQLVDLYKKYIDQMRAKLPELFGTLPKAGLEVQPVPAYMEKQQAAAYYQQGTPDGKRPGIVFVNTYNFADRSLADVEAVAYHEGLPGHHLQIAIAQELTGVPEFRKQSYYTAYTEGWGLYSERLGKEVGFYQDPYSDYGRLEADIWRAIRLVVDTGVHSKHWTRQQMVDFFREHSAIDETNIQSEVDRYIAWPAQALGYKMGQLKLIELRTRSEKALGPKFDIRKFHDLVIDSGALPLDVLDKRVDDWIKSQE